MTMINKAPVVYVPTQPEGNGLTLPILLSLLAHGIIIGILIYLYHHPTDPERSIETVMVSPEQLAQMQGQILANRAAAADGSRTESHTDTPIDSTQTSAQALPSSSSNDQNFSRQSPNQAPVFTRSDDSSDHPMLMSEAQQQQLTEQNQAYERDLSEWTSQSDDAATRKLEQVQQDKQNQRDEEQQKLQDFRSKQNSTPNIERPTSSDRNIAITSGKTGKSFSLSDGESTLSGSTATSSMSKGSSRSASGGRGTSNSEIIGLIKQNYNPPTAKKGSSQRATLTITVNAQGDVINVSVSGSDSAVNEAARQAVLSTHNLPIDTDDPKFPTFTIQFRGSN